MLVSNRGREVPKLSMLMHLMTTITAMMLMASTQECVPCIALGVGRITYHAFSCQRLSRIHSHSHKRINFKAAGY